MLDYNTSGETAQKTWIRRTAWLLVIGGGIGFLIQLHHLFGRKVLMVTVAVIVAGMIAKRILFRPKAILVDLTRSAKVL